MRGIIAGILFALAACGDGGGSGEPEVEGASLTTDEDAPVAHTVEARDPDGRALTLEAEAPAHGAVTVDRLRVTYTPSPDYHGADSFVVKVSNGEVVVSARIDVTVRPVNDAPAAADDAFAGAEDTPLVRTHAALLANDVDVDGDPLTVASVGGAVNGTVSSEGAEVTFLPAPDFSGMASFEYTITDGAATSTATVTVAVGGENDAPTAGDDAATTPEDTAIDLAEAALLANDTDPEDQTLTVIEVGNPTNGAVALGGGVATFTPAADFHGTATFEYTISDGAATATGTVTITVEPVNDAPVAGDDTAATPEDTPLVLPHAALLANDADVDGPALAITAVQGAVHGAAVLGATTVTFTPDPGFAGTASFEYVVGDGLATDTATVTIAVGTPLISIAIAPGPIAIDQQQRVQLRAIGTYSDGTTADLTAAAAWASTDAAIAIVGTGGAANGRVDGLTTAGEATISATVGAISGAATVDVGAATCRVRINELQVAGDGASAAADELAELVNPCTFPIDVTGWTLVYRSATGTADVATATVPLEGTMAPGSFRLYVGTGYNGGGTPDGVIGASPTGSYAAGGGGLAVRAGPVNTGPVVDSVAWGTATNAFVEGAAAAAPPANRSIGRAPFDGADGDSNAADLVLTDPAATPPTLPTPGATNFP